MIKDLRTKNMHTSLRNLLEDQEDSDKPSGGWTVKLTRLLATEKTLLNDSQRHIAWTVAGWLGVVFGVIGILCSCVYVLFILGSCFDNLERRGFSSPAGASDFLPALGFVLMLVLFLGISLLAFYAGRGLLRRRSYGRICTLLFGVLSIVSNAFAAFYLSQNFLDDAWRALQKTEPPNGPSLVSRFVEVLELMPLYLGCSIALALLCRSVYLHREAFK